MRPGAAALALCALAVLGSAPPAPAPPLPARMADTGGGTQLITAVAPERASTTGTVTWWNRVRGRWVEKGSVPARFGANGLAAGASRTQGTNTTPTGLYGLPYAFGIEAAPPGTAYPYRRVHQDSWWCQDNDSRSYNRWTEPRAADCRAAESEHLITYRAQYAHALVIGFNYERPVRGRGAGIFLHVNGRGATAGCVSVSEDAMRRILRWADPARRPHIAVGTRSGSTAVTRL
ncbi:L,D-transpeptidase family protein [Streptomyces sp. NEAU-H22]|uniref:L,D-transpeptidase family protein n=1 Tax=unclassified Streptomyces TaxID=2593676 RepID=UPI00224F22C3|nr:MULTISPECIES: L,D-transpeptidase family protein [unclassified Streptomyces]MCX3289368.1 L,D-transpeptidase family protein [Streptomyces sp. NEAU-H22]WMD07643.1 L,D-transpeptidase family protein [Streptomyces sp. FXY-T5]